MATFKVLYPSGKTETINQSDCSTVEQFVNMKFGRGCDIAAHGVKLIVVGAEEPVVVEKPKAKKSKKDE